MSQTGTCAFCKAAFSRNRHETTARFEGRKFCSPACFNADKAAKVLAKMKPRTCEHCRQVYHPPAGLRRASEWTGRRYCSDACSRAARIRTAEPKCCPICKTEFHKPLGASVPRWEATIYCGKACADVGRSQYWAKRRTQSEPRPSSPRRAAPISRPLPPAVRKLAPVKLPPGKVETVEEYLARKGGITRCPPAFAAPSDHYRAPSAEDAEAFRRHHDELNAVVRGEHMIRAKRGGLASARSAGR